MKNLVRLMTLLALLIAPLGMLSGTSAMAAMPSANTSISEGHCAEMAGSHDQTSDEQAPTKSVECMLDCMMLCSGMLSIIPQLAERLELPPMALTASSSSLVRGLTPQAEPRPPQFS